MVVLGAAPIGGPSKSHNGVVGESTWLWQKQVTFKG